MLGHQGQQALASGSEFGGVEFGGLRGGAGYQVGDAQAVAGQQVLLVRGQPARGEAGQVQAGQNLLPGRANRASFFTPNGIYGRIQWWACICYVITLAVQIPFLDQTFFVGSLVKPLGGADISWIVGFALASLLYLAGAKALQRGPAGSVGDRWFGFVGLYAAEG